MYTDTIIANCSFLEEYAKCISYLGECVQLIHPMDVIYGLWLIKLKTVE
jgi:hypothetical protein